MAIIASSHHHTVNSPQLPIVKESIKFFLLIPQTHPTAELGAEFQLQLGRQIWSSQSCSTSDAPACCESFQGSRNKKPCFLRVAHCSRQLARVEFIGTHSSIKSRVPADAFNNTLQRSVLEPTGSLVCWVEIFSTRTDTERSVGC